MKKIFLLLYLIIAAQVFIIAQDTKQLAFPTAEGYGKYTKGGRGGNVYEVTNLNDSGKGSLREAVEAKGPRTVVFRVSGTIELKRQLRINNPYITIAGQTAPGDGICLRGYPLSINADEVIVRYIRVRLGDETGTESDAISCRFHKNIILDHVSASWSVDETMSIYHCENVTVQWCMITESLFASNHVKGAHGLGGIWGGDYTTYHHNLIACHSSRNPRFCGGAGHTDYRNNVIYNWGYNSCYGGGGREIKQPRFNFTRINMVGNYYKPGPATAPEVRTRIANPSWQNGDCGKWYVSGNYVEGAPDVTENNKLGIHPNEQRKSILDSILTETPWPSMAIRQHSAKEAFRYVMSYAGASIKRDIVDKRIISDTKEGKATFEGKEYKERKHTTDQTRKTGIIDSQNDVGGWPNLNTLPAPDDSDHDGMPDEWECKNSLNPNDASDRNKLFDDGRTALEHYLDSLTMDIP